MTEPTLVTIDPDADVKLELRGETGTTRLLASSKALGLASPVFAAMFRSKFKEGLGHPRPSSDTPVVPLPDDDLEVITCLCKVFHHQMTDVPACLTVECLETMAVTADKYDCVSALAHSSILWLHAGLKEYDRPDHSRLLTAAYLLDSPILFSDISWDFVTKAMVTVTLPAESVAYDLAKNTVLPAINHRRTKVHIALVKVVEATMPPELLDCAIANTSVVPWITALSRKNLWPPSACISGGSVSAFLAKLPEVDDVSRPRCDGSQCSFCPGDMPAYRKKLLEGSDEALGERIGLCLDCVKRGKTGYLEGQCRVKHK